MKAGLKKTVLIATTIFVLIQFVQPARNESRQVLDKDISKTVAMPEGVQKLLSKSCFDCHSNNTRYPWYARIQPGAWFMAYHVRNGKDAVDNSLDKARRSVGAMGSGGGGGYIIGFNTNYILLIWAEI